MYINKHIIRTSEAGDNNALESALAKIGVEANTDANSGNLQIKYDPEFVSKRLMTQTIEDSGFDVLEENLGKIKTDGMTCSACKESIEGQLKNIGVSADANFATNEVTIGTYDAEKVSATGIAEILGEKKFTSRYQLLQEERPTTEPTQEITLSSNLEDIAEVTSPSVPTLDKEKAELSDASAAALSCCIATMAGDLAKVAEVGNAGAGKYTTREMNYPDTKSQLGIGIVAAVAGFCGACASLETFTSAKEHVKRLKEALRHTGTIQEFVGKSQEKGAGDLDGLDAIELFLKRQLRKAQFVKWVPGATSAATSGSLGLGGILYKASPIGLGLACIDNISHIVETTRLIQEHGKNKNFLEKQLLLSHRNDAITLKADRENLEAQLTEVNKEISTCKKRRFGAIGSAIGGALLLAPSTAAYGTAVTKSPWILGVAAVSLVPGIVMSVAYNPYEDLGWRREFSERLEKFSEELGTSSEDEAVRMQSTVKFFNETLKSELVKGLGSSKNMQEFSQKYQREINGELSGIRRILNKTSEKLGVAGSRTLSFIASPVTLLGNAGKSARDQYKKGKNDGDTSYLKSGWRGINRGISFVLWPLEKSGDFLTQTANEIERASQNGIVSSLKETQKHRSSALRNFPGNIRDAPEGLDTNRADDFYEVLRRNPELHNEVIKNFAKHSLRQNGTFRTPYARFFSTNDGSESTATNGMNEVVKKICRKADTSPCCPVEAENMRAFSAFHETLSDQQRQQFYKYLGESFDRVCFFGQTAKSDGRYYSRMLGAYNSIEKKRAQSSKETPSSVAHEVPEVDRTLNPSREIPLIQDTQEGRIRRVEMDEESACLSFDLKEGSIWQKYQADLPVGSLENKLRYAASTGHVMHFEVQGRLVDALDFTELGKQPTTKRLPRPIRIRSSNEDAAQSRPRESQNPNESILRNRRVRFEDDRGEASTSGTQAPPIPQKNDAYYQLLKKTSYRGTASRDDGRGGRP